MRPPLSLASQARFLVERARAPVDEADRNGWTPVMFAAREGQAAMVRGLLELGAAVTRTTARDALAEYRGAPDERGEIEGLLGVHRGV